MLRLGVACEGPTDFAAIHYFLRQALLLKGVDSEILSLQPVSDSTRPHGGWAKLLQWLEKNPPSVRIPRFFGGGLFENLTPNSPIDALIVQMDSDILGDEIFSKFVLEKFEVLAGNPDAPTDRANEVRRILSAACRHSEMTNADQQRHVICPAVESTEAWCIAAFSRPQRLPEEIRGPDLVNSFMQALERSEGRIPQGEYQDIDKSQSRREKFCERHAVGADRVLEYCTTFREAVDSIEALT